MRTSNHVRTNISSLPLYFGIKIMYTKILHFILVYYYDGKIIHSYEYLINKLLNDSSTQIILYYYILPATSYTQNLEVGIQIFLSLHLARNESTTFRTTNIKAVRNLIPSSQKRAGSNRVVPQSHKIRLFFLTVSVRPEAQSLPIPLILKASNAVIALLVLRSRVRR